MNIQHWPTIAQLQKRLGDSAPEVNNISLEPRQYLKAREAVLLIKEIDEMICDGDDFDLEMYRDRINYILGD